MSIELAFIVTCDRCGATATVPRSMSGGKHDGARTALAKVGWTRARDATVRDLCPRCGPGPCDRCGAPAPAPKEVGLSRFCEECAKEFEQGAYEGLSALFG